MRVKSDAAPPCAFIVEPMPGQPGKSRIRFFDNAEQIAERTHWEFDEYHLVVDEHAGIDGVVMENYASMIERAKIAEELQGENPLPDGMDGKEVRMKYNELGYEEEMRLCMDLLSECMSMVVASKISKGVQLEIDYCELSISAVKPLALAMGI